ncbi:MAG: ribosome small subunit-dependent GTPase A [Actinomycetota bacterium]|nr:ribosome small subunit-dependent GTPase A [Actinomycetota bacterium]
MADLTSFADPAAFLRHVGAGPATCSGLVARLESWPAATRAGRVIRAERSGAEVATTTGLERVTWDEPVCTGDWVLVAAPPGDGDLGRAGGVPVGATVGVAVGVAVDDPAKVVYLEPRRTAFVRRSADVDRPQVLAANIDETWIVVPADQPLSPSRMERTLVLAWESGADPVLVVTKADLATPARDDATKEVMASVGPDIPLVSVSSSTGEGLVALAARVGPGRTAALLGSSGAGKSSLVNALAGADVAAVGAVRHGDGKGRHTTSWRELVVLPDGGALIDTPGLRGIGLWMDEGGLAVAFADITDMAGSCRFSDCAHHYEPGCAVLAAIAGGSLPRRRLDSFIKLHEETAEAERRHRSREEDQQRRAVAAATRKIRRRDQQR